MDWSRVEYLDYCDILSAVCTLILTAPIHCRVNWWESDVMQNFSKSILMNKQTHLYLGSWPEGEYIFQQISIFGWTIPLITIN